MNKPKILKRPMGFPNTAKAYASPLLDAELIVLLHKSRSISPDVISGTFTKIVATMYAASIARADQEDRAQTLDDMIEILRTETELRINDMIRRANKV